MTHRFWVGLALSVPLLAMVMAAHVSMSFAALTTSRSAVWVQLVLGEAMGELFRFGPLHLDDAAIAVATGASLLLFLNIANRLFSPEKAGLWTTAGCLDVDQGRSINRRYHECYSERGLA